MFSLRFYSAFFEFFFSTSIYLELFFGLLKRFSPLADLKFHFYVLNFTQREKQKKTSFSIFRNSFFNEINNVERFCFLMLCRHYSEILSTYLEKFPTRPISPHPLISLYHLKSPPRLLSYLKITVLQPFEEASSNNIITTNARHEKEIEHEDLEMVYPWFKIAAKIVHESGQLECSRPGRYSLFFCNKISWLQRRTVNLTMQLSDGQTTRRYHTDGTFSTAEPFEVTNTW